MTPRHDIYATVTNQLIAAIEAGSGSWTMPWHHSGAPVMRPTSVAGRAYRGINRLVLWATAEERGYGSGIWATYQQWAQAGGQVRKGEKGTHVILWKPVDRQDDAACEAASEDGAGRARFFARSFVAFNRDQVDGAQVVEADAIVAAPPAPNIADALAFFERVGVRTDYGLYDAHYRPDLDRIYMPERATFTSDAALISTLGHETVHATGHPNRLARETLRDYHKNRSITAREEMVAEIGASYLMADLGLAYTPRPDHAAYLTSWLTHLRNDPRAIFKAAAQAQAAADWIHAAAAKPPQSRAAANDVALDLVQAA